MANTFLGPCRPILSPSLRSRFTQVQAQPRQQSSGKGFGSVPRDPSPSPPASPPQAANDADVKRTEILPRQKVLDACLATSAVMAVLGVAGCVATPPLLSLVGSSIESISVDSLVTVPSPADILVAAGTGCAVTATRFALMLVWSDLKESTDASNLQVCPISASLDLCILRQPMHRLCVRLYTIP